MRLLLILAVVLLFNDAFPQNKESQEIDLERLVDEIFPLQDEDLDYAELYENYAQLLVNKLNLNLATPEQLRSLSILNEVQLSEFLRYREENGPLLSVYELQVIPTFTETTIRLMRPFVTVSESSTRWKNIFSRILHEDNNYFVVRIERTLEDKLGYTQGATLANRYIGSPEKVYNRFRVSSSSDFSLGFTAEKDAGEQFRWDPSVHHYLFDHLSAHLQIQNKGPLTNLVLGDFQAQFGQGLTLGGGFGMGKGSETITSMRRSNLGFLPYVSAGEFGFLRGIGSSMSLGKSLIVHAFYSHTTRDANTQTTVDSLESASSFPATGFHRTIDEIESRRNIHERNLGSVIQFKSSLTDFGAIIHRTEFSTPLLRKPTPYNQFAFTGSENTNVGFYCNQSIRNFSLFSELSHSIRFGTAGIVGVLASVGRSFDVSLVYRQFEKDFYSFYSNAVAESSLPQNETGFYWGWKYRFSKTHLASGYVDLFRFPWLRFRSYRPSDGSEWMFRYNFSPSKTVQLFGQVRQESKVRNLGDNGYQYTTAVGTKTNYWINADYKVGTNLSFKTRVQLTSYKLGATLSKGFVIVQDLNYRWRQFTISGRLALFDTDNYDTRLYLYERDAWLSFSIPALQGLGTRKYILTHYQVSKKLDLWFRWAQTEYENEGTLGSAGELIQGNRKNDFKVQVRIRL